MISLYRFSLICGILPLGLGCLIYILWRLTDADWLIPAGIFNIYGGVILFLLGVISLIAYYFKYRKNVNESHTKNIVISLSILLINFPVAVVLAFSAIEVINTSTVSITNSSKYTIDELTLINGNHSYKIGHLLPKGKIKKDIRFKSEGEVRYSFIRSREKIEGTLLGYVTGGMSFNVNMIIFDNNVEINEEKSNNENKHGHF